MVESKVFFRGEKATPRYAQATINQIAWKRRESGGGKEKQHLIGSGKIGKISLRRHSFKEALRRKMEKLSKGGTARGYP